MEGRRVGAAVAEDDTARAVGVAQVEVGVFEQLAHSGQHVATPVGRTGLQGKPFVDDQRLVVEHGVKALQRIGRQGAAADHQGRQRVEAVGHIAGVFEALVGFAGPHSVAAVRSRHTQHGERQAGQSAAARAQAVGAVGAVVFVGVKGPGPVLAQAQGELAAHGFAHGVDALRVDHRHLLGDVGFGRQGEHQLFEGGVQCRVAQHGAQGLHRVVAQRCGAGRAIHGQGLQRVAQHQALAGFPAVEGIAVVCQQQAQLGVVVFGLQNHRGREAAQQRGHRRLWQAAEGDALCRFGQHQGVLLAQRGAVGQHQWQGLALVVQQAQRHRDHKGQFLLLARGGGAALLKVQAEQALFGLVFGAHHQAGRAGLAVPALELGQVLGERTARVGVCNGLGKVVAGHGLAVVALEIQVHALAETLAAHQGLHHAHHFGAFFIHRDGVEIVDLDILVGAHRVGHGARVFGELGGAQHPHVLDALDRARRRIGTQVHAELLVAKDGQTFFERELEPVAAGDAVAAPVVEILVAHHRFDVGEIGVGGGGAVGQHVFGVEDVEALVLHRAHVEVAGGDDHETLQIERQAKTRFVPSHAGHERVHRVFGFVHVAGAHKHLQQVFGAAAADDALLARHQLAGHQRKQVAGLFVRVDPLGEVAATVQIALFHQVAVAQQHRIGRFVGAQGDAVARHHVRAVQEIGDAAKALGFTLREEGALAHIQTHELGVALWNAGGEDFQVEGLVAFGQVFQHQGFAVHLERAARAIDQHPRQIQIGAIQAQRLQRRSRVAAQTHFVEHPGFGWVQIEGEVHRVDQVGGRGVVLAANGGGGLSFTHGQIPCLSDASIKASRSPSSTFWVAEISTLVRRSLMRLLSST